MSLDAFILWICYQQSRIAYTCCSPHIAALHVHPICKMSSLQVLRVLETMGTSLIELEGALSKMAKTSSKAAAVARLLSLKNLNDVSEMKDKAEKKIQEDKVHAQAISKARIERMKKWCCKGKNGKRTSSVDPTFAVASTEAKEKAAEAKVSLNLVIGTSNLEKAEEDACTAIKDMAKDLAKEMAKEMAKDLAKDLAKEMAKEMAKDEPRALEIADAKRKAEEEKQGQTSASAQHQAKEAAVAAEKAAAEKAAAEAAAAAAAPASRWNQLGTQQWARA